MASLAPVATASLDLRPWAAAAALALLGGGVLALGAWWSPAERTASLSRAVPARPASAPVRPDDPATLLNNTPLAIAPADAQALNAARAVDRVRLAAARPFLLAAVAQPAGAGAALQCLTQAVYFEAASESDRGQRAVAQVVLNRVRNPIFPHSVCGVVFQGSQLPTGCQFSFTCDGSLARRPSDAGWERARRNAAAALAGGVERSVGLSTHYHADYVVPYWAGSLDKVATIGAHIFYTMRGQRGRPGAFDARYDGAAETPPTLSLDPAQLAAMAGSDAVAGAEPRAERTVVAEDALGAPGLAPAPSLAAAAGALRADEARGELVADARGGSTLDGGR